MVNTSLFSKISIATFCWFTFAIITIGGLFLGVNHTTLFNFCDSIMFWLADVFHITYEQSCVYFNLWGEATLCLLSTLVVFVLSLLNANKNRYMSSKILFIISVLWMLYVLYWCYGYLSPYWHMSVTDQFEKSVADLLKTIDHTSQKQYEIKNLIEYVLKPFIILYLNLLGTLWAVICLRHKFNIE